MASNTKSKQTNEMQSRIIGGVAGFVLIIVLMQVVPSLSIFHAIILGVSGYFAGPQILASIVGDNKKAAKVNTDDAAAAERAIAEAKAKAEEKSKAEANKKIEEEKKKASAAAEEKAAAEKAAAAAAEAARKLEAEKIAAAAAEKAAREAAEKASQEAAAAAKLAAEKAAKAEGEEAERLKAAAEEAQRVAAEKVAEEARQAEAQKAKAAAEAAKQQKLAEEAAEAARIAEAQRLKAEKKAAEEAEKKAKQEELKTVSGMLQQLDTLLFSEDIDEIEKLVASLIDAVPSAPVSVQAAKAGLELEVEDVDDLIARGMPEAASRAVEVAADGTASAEVAGQGKRGKRKPRYPKGFDINKPLAFPRPDPERWLHKTERAAYKKMLKNMAKRGVLAATTQSASAGGKVTTKKK